MAKYIDLAQTGTGHEGTELDPFSWADYVAYVNVAGVGDFYIKGSATVTLWPDEVTVNVSPWNFETNGPYRLRVDMTALNTIWFKGLWKNGIIEFYNQPGSAVIKLRDVNLNNIFIHTAAGTGIVMEFRSCVGKGCTIIAEGLSEGCNIVIFDGNTGSFTDSIIQAAAWATDGPW